MLSKLMLLKSNVLVLDDPTNHLDLESISSLNDGLKNFKESIIFASHDHEFIQTLANHIIVLSKNGVIDRIDETYDEFLENAEVQAKVKRTLERLGRTLKNSVWSPTEFLVDSSVNLILFNIFIVSRETFYY